MNRPEWMCCRFLFLFFANVAQEHAPPPQKKSAAAVITYAKHTAGNDGTIKGGINTSLNRNKLCQKLAMFLCSTANDWTYAVDAKTDPSGSGTTN